MPATDIDRPTRGLKNRNPGNLRFHPEIKWRGQIGQDSKGFCVFDIDENGIRAIVKDLKTDYFRDGQKTILALLSEYAPPTENHTMAYARFVADALHIGVEEEIAFNEATAEQMVRAIIKMENGVQPYSDDVIRAGVQAAFA